MSRYLYLVRHGEQQDAEHGLPDGPLSPRGVRQAQALAERLGGVPFTEAWTSPLQRAQETARVARVEPQARTQVADGAAGLADLVEQPRLRERTTAAEIVGIKDADTLRNRAAEAADGVDVDVGHYLTLVKHLKFA